MRKSTKAVLLSALVFPGTGHLILKKFITGIVLVSISFASVYYIMSKSVEESMRIVEQIENGEVQPDMSSIEELVSQRSSAPDAYLLDIATWLFIICWLFGIVDSYRVGRLRDKNDSAFWPTNTTG